MSECWLCTNCTYISLMEETVNINPNKLYTKMAYHKLTGKSRATIDKLIEGKKLGTLKINGATLVKP